MSKVFRILNDELQAKHDNPPKFNAAERKHTFYISKDLEKALYSIRGSANKVFFLVKFAYFKNSAQFYSTYKDVDIKYACRKLNIESKYEAICKAKYNSRSQHEKKILELFGIKRFNHETKDIAKSFLAVKLRERCKPREAFFALFSYLLDNRYQVPKYSILSKLISDAYNDERHKQLSIIDTLNIKAKSKLNSLVDISEDYKSNIKYKLTNTKNFSHSIKPKKVKENIQRNKDLQDIYSSVSSVFERLNLSTEQIRSFSSYAEINDVIQLKRKNDRLRNLYLTVYTANQYYRLQDILAKSLCNIIKKAFSTADKKAKDEYYKSQKHRDEAIQSLQENTDSLITQLTKIQKTIKDMSLTPEAKEAKLLRYINRQEKSVTTRKQEIKAIDEQLVKTSATTLFYKYLEESSSTIQDIAKPIILSLEFDYSCLNNRLSSAIQYYRRNLGTIKSDAPVGFIPKKDKHWIIGANYFNADLYVLVLFKEICTSLLGGDLALLYSHLYPGIERILISKNRFKKQRDKLLDEKDMSQYSDCNKLLEKLEVDLNEAYMLTNQNILSGTNTYISGNRQSGYKVHSERNTQYSPEELVLNDTIELYPAENSISLVEALNTVNNTCGFLKEFDHTEDKYIKKRPSNTTFYAVIMSLAHHFKPSTFSKLADAVNNKSVDSALKAYATKENFTRASDSIIQFVNKLPVADLFDTQCSSSDGQKYTALKESLNSNFSFKYGGKERVLSEFKSADSRGMSFSPYLIDGAKLEAHSLFDALFNSGSVSIHTHTTDSHGATLANFAIASLTDIEFAPRIRNFKKCRLYTIGKISKYKKSKYIVRPDDNIDVDLIRDHYEDILRVVVSLKLGITTSNQLFRRLNSYTKNNALYKAFVELGKIHRTLHLLKYMDDRKFRDEIQAQLNKGEHLNRLDKTLAIGSAGYNVANKEDQELIVQSKMLLKNVMICWNYMHLSQRIINAKTLIEKLQIRNQMKNSWPAAWLHFLIYGKFDLSVENAKDSQNFQIEKMTDPKLLDF